jgi:hypothetical protein
VRTISRFLALMFFASALGWWAYSPAVNCDPSPAGGCDFLDLRIGHDLGLVASIGVLILLTAAGVLLWVVAQERD